MSNCRYVRSPPCAGLPVELFRIRESKVNLSRDQYGFFLVDTPKIFLHNRVLTRCQKSRVKIILGG